MLADPTALLLARWQFAFAVSFHLLFPALTIGPAAYLAVLGVVAFVLRAWLAWGRTNPFVIARGEAPRQSRAASAKSDPLPLMVRRD
jgi:hypothetical protein